MREDRERERWGGRGFAMGTNPHGVEAYEQAKEERRALFQQAKRARLMAEDESRREDEGPKASSSAPPAQVKEGDLSFVPKGWFDCPPCGDPIGLFIPCKVPLSAAYNERIPEGKSSLFSRSPGRL